MRLPKGMIEHLAHTIVRDLLAKDLITTTGSTNDLIARVRHVITEDLLVEDRLNEEVRDLLKEHATDLAKGNIEYQKMFMLVKRKLIKERGLIL